MIIAMRAHATKPDAPPKLICLMMSGRGRCPHLRRPDKRGSTVLGSSMKCETKGLICQIN